jgi:hypothetical protein
MNVHTSATSRFAAVLAIAMLASPAAHAQATNGDKWRYEVTPYLWAAGVVGTTRVDGITVNASPSFSDILSNLDFALMGTFEARRGRWGVLFDGFYVKVSDEPTITQGKVRFDLTQQLYSLSGTWRAIEDGASVDLLGGLRFSYLKPEIGVARGSIEDTNNMVGPFIGVRGIFPLSERWKLFGYLDAGTYGGGDYDWQIAAGAIYTIDADTSVKFGYRQLYTTYNKTASETDTRMHGLYLGVGFRF